MSLTYADKPWTKSYDKGVPESIDVPAYPVQHFLEEAARRVPTNTALVFQGKELTYDELNKASDAIAAGLAANGFKKGDRAVIYMPNLPQFVIIYYGILKAGGIVIATNPLYTERELQHQLKDCGAETVFVLSRYYPLLKKVQKSGGTNVKRIIVAYIKDYLPGIKSLLYGLVKEKKEGDRVDVEPGDMTMKDFMALGARSPKPNVTVTGDDIALLQYTGGTTGLSKGAIGLHRNLVANALMVSSWIDDWKYGADTLLGAIPFFHSYGMVTAVIFTVAIGGRLLIIPNPRDLPYVLESINKYKPAYFPGVPAMYVGINNNKDVAAGKYDLRSIRACISGSAPLLVETKKKFEELTGGTLVEGYGLTESHVATHANPLKGKNPIGSIGLPLPGVEARIVDPVEGNDELPIGAIGELIMRGPTIMQGYWNMPNETASSLRDGWLYTGDIARMDEEGYFYIEDRKKDLIICGGYNVYPREIEEVLSRHPAVMEVSVAGVPDPKRGENVMAWVVKRPGFESVTEAEIIEWSKGELAAYKYPRLIQFRDELPKTTVGKVLKRELVREYKEKANGKSKG
ncbi:MAG TPA: long-chain fatty acid--CoA ligase [Promineifilum sp.]|nr:long-chain fatty acid--CoA ligase [Promineifilum sp.]HRO89864.1 long-chain fatty acid--CoA ligase [Promineifilum sp.]HRQ15121.1 long-chain fatty acid--CoA ligase [Promineifilum sp.]